MKNIALFALLTSLFLAARTDAAEFELLAWGTWVDPTEEEGRLVFDREFGVGGGVNVYWSDRVSTEFAVKWVRPDFLVFRGSDFVLVLINTEGLNIVPVTAVAQYHFRTNAKLRPYLGAGVAYIFFGDVDRGELPDLGDIDIGDDYGFVLNAGFKWPFSDRWSLDANVKFLPGDAEATLVDDEPTTGEAAFSPLIYSAGISFRF